MDGQYYDHRKIARLRERAGLSKEQMAAQAGVALMTIYRVENGTGCSPELLAKIARLLRVSWKSLIHDQPLAA